MAALPITLPDDAVVLHVGPHKTGTTAVQSAFFAARDRLDHHGVIYPGVGRTPMRAVTAVTGVGPMTGEPELDIRNWTDLVAEIPSRGRVVISSEFFADAVGETVDRIVADMGAERLHVVVTLRPLDRIAPSQWQQYVQNGRRVAWRRWLRGLLLSEASPAGFWRRHRHDDLVRRWVAALGADRVHVVVIDESDRGALMRTFEALVGLPDGTLVPESDRGNRSLTYAEVELVRALNIEFRQREWQDRDYREFVRLGVNRALKAASPVEGGPRITLPVWAVDRLREISMEIVDGIRASGAEIIGDLDALIVAPPGPDTPKRIRRSVPASSEVAARAVAGAIEAALAERERSTLRGKVTLARRASPGRVWRKLRRSAP